MTSKFHNVMLRLDIDDEEFKSSNRGDISTRGRSVSLAAYREGTTGKYPVRVSPIRKTKRSVHDEETDETERFIIQNPGIDAERLLIHKAIYDLVFDAWPSTYGKQISRSARDSKRITASSLVYGEITYASFFATLEKIHKQYGGLTKNGVFYDLGSGAGKPVIAAATIFPFGYCRGLEYLGELVVASIEAKERFDEVARPKLEHLFQNQGGGNPAQLEFVCADMTDLRAFDWSDGDIVFANSTCFDDALMSALAKAASALRQGAFFITFTKSLPSPEFEICESMLYQMSWGGATVFIQRKSTPSGKIRDLTLQSSIKAVKDEEARSAEPYVDEIGESISSYSYKKPAEVPISEAWLSKLTDDDDSFGEGGVAKDPISLAATQFQRSRQKGAQSTQLNTAVSSQPSRLPRAPPDQGGLFTL
mmetsp:Transcript_17181/g.22338  ORF Transcript_17181/g.22338 Transcript_17181/m.22338 type:complete len:421 (+) Transcript_17181:115-1377(+)